MSFALKYNQLQANLAGVVTAAKENRIKFAIELNTHPINTLEWADNLFAIEGKAHAAKEALAMLPETEREGDMIGYIQDAQEYLTKLVMNSVSTSYSTSQSTNLINASIGVGAKDLLKYFRSF